MRNKIYAAFLALMLVMSFAASAYAETANAVVIAPETVKVTAPFSGTLLPFDWKMGDRVEAGQTLFELDTVPVYAPVSGVAAAVFAQIGDDASGVAAHYGALAVIEPEHPLYVAASTQGAYYKDENKFIHVGETLYLKSGDETGAGIVTQVSGKNYVVEIRTGEFHPEDSIDCYRESSLPADSDVGRGAATRYPDITVNAAGRIVNVLVKPGDEVQVGDVLFEVVDGQSAPNASPAVQAPVSGALTVLGAVSGAQVYRGMLLCEIADLSTLELSVEVDEVDLTRIKLGHELDFTLDAYPGETFTGTVKEIRPLATQKQNAAYFDVRLAMPDGITAYPGINATVTIG